MTTKSTRGLDETEKKVVGAEPPKPKPTVQPTKITKVLDFGSGWMIVEMDDGLAYKRDGGSLAWRTNNVGNLKFGKFAERMGAIGKGHNDTAVFPTKAMGDAAMHELLFGANSRYLDMTIKNAISTYAPDYDGNDSAKYTDYVCKHARLSYLRTLKSLTGDERLRMIAAMQAMEGFKKGTILKVSK